MLTNIQYVAWKIYFIFTLNGVKYQGRHLVEHKENSSQTQKEKAHTNSTSVTKVNI